MLTLTLIQDSTASAAGADSTSVTAGDGGSRFVTAGPGLKLISYPVVCAHTINTPRPFFVVAYSLEGISMLQSSDIAYSITEGLVDTCALIPIVQGKHLGDVDNDFEQRNDEIEASW